MKKTLSIFALGAMSLNVFATDTNTTTKISGINFVDENTLSIGITPKLSKLSENSEAEILEEVEVSEASKSLEDAKKINLKLKGDLIKGKSYSIISVSEDLDTSVDFDYLEDSTSIENEFFIEEETSIKSVSIVDTKNLEISLNKEPSGETFDFKVYKKIVSENIFLDTSNVNLQLSDSLISNKNYILILTLKDENENSIDVENSLYDFTTPEFSANTETPNEEVIVDEVVTNTDDVVKDANTSVENVANDDVNVVVENDNIVVEDTQDVGASTAEEKMDLEEVAMKASNTPETGTKTNLLIILSLIFSLIILQLRVKKQA